ncbi:MAG: hypothetical protein QXW42_04240 [Thermofilum sp.]
MKMQFSMRLHRYVPLQEFVSKSGERFDRKDLEHMPKFIGITLIITSRGLSVTYCFDYSEGGLNMHEKDITVYDDAVEFLEALQHFKDYERQHALANLLKLLGRERLADAIKAFLDRCPKLEEQYRQELTVLL